MKKHRAKAYEIFKWPHWIGYDFINCKRKFITVVDIEKAFTRKTPWTCSNLRLEHTTNPQIEIKLVLYRAVAHDEKKPKIWNNMELLWINIHPAAIRESWLWINDSRRDYYKFRKRIIYGLAPIRRKGL